MTMVEAPNSRDGPPITSKNVSNGNRKPNRRYRKRFYEKNKVNYQKKLSHGHRGL